METQQRTALVTGGAKRVGRAIVRRLAEAGFEVWFTYRHSEKEAAELASDIASRGGKAEYLKIDLEADDACARISEWVERHASRLDVLVNNASLYLPDDPKLIVEMTRRLHRVNYEAPVNLARQLAPLLKRARGHVINLIDLMAERPMPGYSAYCASKAALLNATLSLARELAPEATVNGISPGVVEWPEDLSLQQRETYLARVPLKRAGTPEDVANLVHFLATEGGYITGQIIRLDGGRSLV
jgi:pteridine reductase